MKKTGYRTTVEEREGSEFILIATSKAAARPACHHTQKGKAVYTGPGHGFPGNNLTCLVHVGSDDRRLDGAVMASRFTLQALLHGSLF